MRETLEVDIEPAAVSAVFQEDRLCESFAVENVTMHRPFHESIPRKMEMAKLLPEECLSRPVSTLSGGMKRRVAVLRACSPLPCPADG